MNYFFYLQIFITLSIGLAIFLYGLILIRNCLTKLSGDKMILMIERLTSNPYKGLLVGALVTAILQSSSGTIAITISLVAAGAMTFRQSIGVIIGANIGTTSTAFLITLNLIQFTPYALLVGLLIYLISRNQSLKYFGLGIIGFSFLFIGLQIIGDQFNHHTIKVQLHLILSRISNPIFGILIGSFLTSIVQSSSATTAIVQSLYIFSIINLKQAVSIMLGNNIGTTITGVFASFGTSTPAKRAALFHILFNVMGVLLILPFLNQFCFILNHVHNLLNIPNHFMIATSHFIFNLLTAFIFIHFTRIIELLIKRIYPDTTP